MVQLWYLAAPWQGTSLEEVAHIRKSTHYVYIRDYFSAVVSAIPLPYSKPHPEVYLQAAKLLDIEPTHCGAFEDSFHGMVAVKAARMRNIVVPPKDHFTDPRWTLADVKLNTLAELTTKHII